MTKAFLSLFLAIATFYAGDALSALSKAEIKNLAKREIPLSASNLAHVRAFRDAPSGERYSYAYYQGLGLVPPRGGVVVAAPAPALVPGLGIPVNYGDPRSVSAAATLLLIHYGLPQDDLWKLSTIHLLTVNRAIPTNAEIRREYDSRLTPLIRNLNALMAALNTKTINEAGNEANALVNTLGADATNARTVKDSADAVAVVSAIRTTLEDQVALLRAARNMSVFKSLAFRRNQAIIANLYGGNIRFQVAASTTVPSMLNTLDDAFRQIAYFSAKVAYDSLVLRSSSYKSALGAAKAKKFFPFLRITKMANGNTRPAMFYFIIQRIASGPEGRLIPGLVQGYLPVSHAKALAFLVYRSKKLNEILKDPEKVKQGLQQEGKKRVNDIFSIVEAIVTRSQKEESTSPTRRMGNHKQDESKRVMRQVGTLIGNIVRAKEHIRTPNMDTMEREEIV